MKNYKVRYEIDVDADNPEDAALQVEQILKDMAYRPALSVISPDGDVDIIDLEEKDVETN